MLNILAQRFKFFQIFSGVASCKILLTSVFFSTVEPVLPKETETLQNKSALGKLKTKCNRYLTS